MAKSSAASVVVDDQDPKSLSDAGFKQCRLDSGFTKVAEWCMGKIPSLGNPEVARADQVPKEDRDELKVGYLDYYNSTIAQPRFFVVVDNNIVEKPEEEWKQFQGEKRTLDVHIAFGIDQAGLTDIRENDKVWYGLVQGLKTDANAYVSNRIGDLVAKAKKIWKKRLGIKAERALTMVFDKREKKMLADLLQYCINADSKGTDSTADVAKTKRRIAAYFATE